MQLDVEPAMMIYAERWQRAAILFIAGNFRAENQAHFIAEQLLRVRHILPHSADRFVNAFVRLMRNNFNTDEFAEKLENAAVLFRKCVSAAVQKNWSRNIQLQTYDKVTLGVNLRRENITKI